MRGRLAVVCGPTASGKSALAVELALRHNGEVVSADSMQIYKGMDIGTAKPGPEEMRGVPHHMLDVVWPGESYSAARYAQEAGAAVDDILGRGRLPVVCGGTGLYIDALLRGADFMPRGDEAMRRELSREWEENPEKLQQKLRAADPDSSRKIEANDKKRIIRALEVSLLTGETISAFNEESKKRPPRYESVMIGLTVEPRQALYERIDRRVSEMLERGLAEEVRGLLMAGRLFGTGGQAIGYKEMTGYLQGKCTLSEAADTIRQKTRNYAKRQLTWFRKDPRIRWVLNQSFSTSEPVMDISTNYLHEAGLI